MRIYDMDIQRVHYRDFEICRDWDRDYLFLYFRTECYVELEGELLEVAPPADLLYRIGSRQHYYAKGETFANDYVHFLFDDSRSFVDELNIPMNTVIPLPENTEVSRLLRLMYEEYISVNEFREKSMEYYFRLALIKVSEISERARMAKVPVRYDEMFRNLRSEIFLNPARDWRVSEAAEERGLSIPYFHKLYKTFFGHTFVQDVVKGRIEQAKHFLLMTDYPVREIAELCGYRSDTFFMKQFKQDTGMTPSQYRREEELLKKE